MNLSAASAAQSDEQFYIKISVTRVSAAISTPYVYDNRVKSSTVHFSYITAQTVSSQTDRYVSLYTVRSLSFYTIKTTLKIQGSKSNSTKYIYFFKYF